MKSRLCLLLLAIVGCGTTDSAFYTRDGRLLSILAPLPYRIVVASFPAPGWEAERLDTQQKDKFWFRLTDEQTHEQIVALLGLDPRLASGEARRRNIGTGTFGVYKFLDGLAIPLQNTAIEVIGIEQRKLVAALKKSQELRADLLIMPRRAEVPRFQYVGSTRTVASFLLWLTTWVGGLHVQDETFDARASFDFHIINPYDGTTLATYTATSEYMDLTLWERNEREFKGGVGWSLIMPPYFTPDEGEPVSNMLSAKVCARIAARLGGYLKQDFASRERATIGTLREISPKNNSTIKETVLKLKGEIVADQPITDFALYIGDQPKPYYEVATSKKEREKLKESEQAQGSIYRIRLNPPRIPLKIGKNLIRIEFAVRGRYTSRTLIYHRSE